MSCGHRHRAHGQQSSRPVGTYQKSDELAARVPSWCFGSTAISQDPGNSHRKVESVIQGLEIWTRKGKKGLFREYSRGQSGYRQGLQKGMGSQVRVGPKGRTFGPLLAGLCRAIKDLA